MLLNAFKPEFSIIIFIHYKPQIDFAILDLCGCKLLEVGENWKNILLFLKQFHEIFCSRKIGSKKLSHSSEMQNDVLMHREGL